MKCLVSKGHYYSSWWGLCPVKGSNDCALTLYFKDDLAIKAHHSVTVNNMNKNKKKHN